MADVTARSDTEGTAEDQGLAEGTSKSIWHSIFLEVDKVSSQLPHDLPTVLLELQIFKACTPLLACAQIFIFVGTHIPR